jgi:hypothetical protein
MVAARAPIRLSRFNITMRKRIVAAQGGDGSGEPGQGWLNLEEVATVEVTSEDAGFPVESAFGPGGGAGWRASEKGAQHIRIIFDEPVRLRRMQLRFHEAEHERTQEFTIRWSPAAGGAGKEIVRQQWNFSPTGSTTEIEDYVVELEAVSVLELTIQPDLGRGEAVASLAWWRMRTD